MTITEASINVPPTPPLTARRNSGSREPRVRSILLSGNKPPGGHARNGGGGGWEGGWQPTVHCDDTRRLPPSDSNSTITVTNVHSDSQSTQLQVDVASGPDGQRQPPSIRIVQAQVDPTPRPEESDPMPPPSLPPVSRTRRMTLDLPHSPIDILYDSDHKLALEGTSPKPCIVPGNALHLIDDDPAAPRSATPPSVIIVGSEADQEDTDYDGEEDADGEPPRSSSQPPVRPVPRVRFRSRVRIASGTHHHHSISATGGSTPGSSTSDSPSSSISAPLRYQADDNAAWGPIGKRLSGYGSGGWQRRVIVEQEGQGQANGNRVRTPSARTRVVGSPGGNTERTPLLHPPRERTTPESDDDDLHSMSEEERGMRAVALRREEEVVFGKWPWRIFNRHWWWWHVEPVLCCCCAEDSDYEEY